MTNSITIETEKLNNDTLFVVCAKCTELGVDTKDVEEINIWVDGVRKVMEFAWNMDKEIIGLQKKW